MALITKWNVIIINDPSKKSITIEDISRWLSSVHFPKCMSMSISDAGYYLRNFGDHAGVWPWPNENDSIVIFRTSAIPGYKGYGGFATSRQCSVAVFDCDSDRTLGNRIWHEVIHAMATYDKTTGKYDVNSDLLNPGITPNDVKEFCEWFKKDPRNHFFSEQRLRKLSDWCKDTSRGLDDDILESYYMMLTEKHFPPCTFMLRLRTQMTALTQPIRLRNQRYCNKLYENCWR